MGDRLRAKDPDDAVAAAVDGGLRNEMDFDN